MKKPKSISAIAYAPLGQRFLAFLIDWYLSSLFAMIPVVIAQSVQGKDLILSNRIDTLPFSTAILVTFVALFLAMLYFCVFPLRSGKLLVQGQTIGRRIMHMRVVSTDARPLNFGTLFLREFIGFFLLQGVLTSTSIYLMSLVQIITKADVVPYFQSLYFVIAGASGVFLIFGSRKQTFHDFISHTRMIAYE